MDGQMIEMSVVVTVYNLEKYIGECLDSILGQKGVTFEVICVDDASSDKSYDILKQYAVKDTRVKVIRSDKNLGLSSARNLGFREAKGKYLYNIDGDDMLAEDALKRMYQCSVENALDLLAFSATAFFDCDEARKYGKEDDYVRKKEYSGVKRGQELFAELMENRDRAACNFVLYCFRREYFLTHDLFGVEGLRYVDDSMFAMYMAAERAMCIPDRLYLRRYREGSAVTSPMQKRYLESMVVLFVSEMMIWHEMEKKGGMDERVCHQVERYFQMRLKAMFGFYEIFKEDSTEMQYLKTHPLEHFFYKSLIERTPLAEIYFDPEELDKMKTAAEVVVYGAGMIAEEVIELLKYYQITNYSIAVTDKKKNPAAFCGREVHEIQEVYRNMEKAYIIIAVSPQYQGEIKKLLSSLGLNNFCVIKKYY